MTLGLANIGNTVGRFADIETGECVVNTSLRPIEIGNLDSIKTLDINFDNAVFILSYSGALVRLYYHDDKWMLSTHNKVDAFSSFWNYTQSFGQLFVNSVSTTVQEFAERDNLDPSMVYTYIIRDAVNPHEDRVMFAGAYAKGTDPYPTLPVFDTAGHKSCPAVPRLYPKSIAELTAIVRVLNKHKIQGLLLFMPGATYKIYAPGYMHREHRQPGFR